MHRKLDTFREFVIVLYPVWEIERQNASLRIDDTVIEKVHCLQDFVYATEALLVDVPEPERHDSAVEAVRSACRAVFPQIPFPPLSDRLADAFRPHWGDKDLWRSLR